MRQVSLREANQNFAKIIAEVEAGGEVVITRRGHAVARLVPEPVKARLSPKRQAAYERMVARMERGVSLGGLRVSREDLYDR